MRDAQGREVLPLPSGLRLTKADDASYEPDARHDMVFVCYNNATGHAEVKRCSKCDLVEEHRAGKGEHTGDTSASCETCGMDVAMRPWKECPKPKTKPKPRINVIRPGNGACYT